MSGGAFDYVYYDASELATRLDEMADYCKRTEGIDSRARLHCEALAEQIRINEELLKAIEWCASGDYSYETVNEEFEALHGGDPP